MVLIGVASARTLCVGPAQPDANASLPSVAFQTATRAYAEREAGEADRID